MEPDLSSLISWSNDMETILENCRNNCIMLSHLHKKEYLYYKSYLKWFKLPIIGISAVNSVVSLGLQPYLQQGYISALNSGLSLICGIIGSVEMFLGINTACENELDMSKCFYLLSVDIYKVLSLDRKNRSIDGKSFLEQTLSVYCKLIEQSNLSSKRISDKLQPLQNNLIGIEISSSDSIITPPNVINSSYTSSEDSKDIL